MWTFARRWLYLPLVDPEAVSAVEAEVRACHHCFVEWIRDGREAAYEQGLLGRFFASGGYVRERTGRDLGGAAR